jgi:predicted TIM-barrel fold metal-dependent hydrolase
MNAPLVDIKASQRLAIVDCDIHPMQRSVADLYPYMPERWREHSKTIGPHMRQGLAAMQAYPRMMAAGQRADAYPANGGPPGCDLDLMRRQHLDPAGVETGMLVALSKGGMEERNQAYARVLAHAVNDWQIEDWVRKEPRLGAGIVVPQEDPMFAAAEIRERAGEVAYRQIILSPRSIEPLGRERYWPIYEAAQECNLPLGLHPAAWGSNPSTGGGWPTYYMQEHYAFCTNMESNLVSMVFEGVFERFPKLRVALIESGFTWIPAMCWRMDRAWERMRKEVPHLKRPPSEYIRERLWFATQPLEEPEDPAFLPEIIEWIGWDRLLFSTDYPHWDYDDPRYCIRFKMTDKQRSMLFRDNARAFYGLT